MAAQLTAASTNLQPVPAQPSGRFLVGERIPAVLTIGELSRGIGISERQVREFTRGGNHPGIVPLPGAGHVRYSGAAVDAWLKLGAPKAPRRPFLSSHRGGRP